LNAIADVREMTFRERIFDKLAITSSVIPSAKNSFSGSALTLRNGRIARRLEPPAGVLLEAMTDDLGGGGGVHV
jgi:hypothetical protein